MHDCSQEAAQCALANIHHQKNLPKWPTAKRLTSGSVRSEKTRHVSDRLALFAEGVC
jgi:hypothetical protein